MGMYTEICVAARIKNDPVVVEVLQYLTQKTTLPPSQLPQHPFFRTERWRDLLCSASAYFTGASVTLFEQNKGSETWALIAVSDLKNYGDEVEKFFDWLRPYIADTLPGTMIGYSRYEEDREPVIYYA